MFTLLNVKSIYLYIFNIIIYFIYNLKYLNLLWIVNKKYRYLMGLLPTRMDRMALLTSHAILSLQSLPSMDSATSLVSEASSSGARFSTALEVSACIDNIGMNMMALRNTTTTPTNPAMATNSGSTRRLAAAWLSGLAGSGSNIAVV